MVDVSQLRALRAVAEAGSLTTAARQLGMSQPGLSRLIDRVEHELGAKLFERGRRGALPTVAGDRVLRYALSTITAYDALIASLGSTRGLAGEVQVITSTTPGEYLMPGLVAEFNKVYPDVIVETIVIDSAAVAERLLSGQAHVGFAGSRSNNGGLRHVPVENDEVVLAVPAGHSFAEAGEIDVSLLAGEKMLRRERGSGTYEVVARTLAENGMTLPPNPPAMALGSTQAMISAVDAGLGIGFVTIKALKQQTESRVVPVRIAGAPVLRDLFLIYEIAANRPRQAQIFIDFVEQWAVRKKSRDKGSR